jgi:ribonuclease HI
MKNHLHLLPSSGGMDNPRTFDFKKVTDTFNHNQFVTKTINTNEIVAAAKYKYNGKIKRGKRTTKSIIRRRKNRIASTRLRRISFRLSRRSNKVDPNLEIIDTVRIPSDIDHNLDVTSCYIIQHESSASANLSYDGFIAKSNNTNDKHINSNNKIKKHKHFISPRSINRIATFNTRTLNTQWKKQEMCAICEAKNISVLMIQEHRIFFDTANNDDPIRKMHIGKGWYFYYTTATPKGIGGIGIILSPFAVSALDSITSISDRILHLQFSSDYEASTFKTSLINVYSPTSAAKVDIVENFYGLLSECCDKIPKGNLLIVGGDFNATILPKKNVYSASRTENRNSHYLQEFMSQIELKAANTFFQKPKCKLLTFHGTNKRKVGLDHILISTKWSKFAINCDVHSPLTVPSDHALLYCDLKWRLSSKPKVIIPNVDWSSLKSDPDIRSAFSASIKNALEDFDYKDHKNYYVQFVASVKTASILLPKKNSIKKRCPWSDNEIITIRNDLIRTKHNARTKKSNLLHIKANALSKELCELYQSKEKQFIESELDKVELLTGDRQYKHAWNLINLLTGRKTKTSSKISGNTPEEIISKWHAHFQALLAKDTSNEIYIPFPKIFNDLNFKTGPITLEELRKAKNSLSMNKALGIDEIAAEVLVIKDLEPILINILEQARITQSVPFEWLTSVMIPVHKKGNTDDCNNYRGIALMSITAKLYNRILLGRLQDVLESKLRINQNGFRPNRSTTQQVLALKRIIEECDMKQQSQMVAVFIDFTKAFDSVSWFAIRAILTSYDVPCELIDCILSLYTNANTRIKTTEGLSNSIQLSVGVLQGDTLAPYLFIIVMDYVMRQAITNDSLGYLYAGNRTNPIKIRNTRNSSKDIPRFITDLEFADDIALLSDNIDNVQEMLNSVEREAALIGLNLNKKKTEYILVGTWDNIDNIQIKVLSGDITRVDDFKYLGCYIRNSCKDFEVRRGLAWNACKKLWKIWKSEHSSELKIRVFRATIESILLYGSETWSLTKGQERKVSGCYSRLLRYILNIKWSDFISNEVLYDGMSTLDIKLRQRRLQFAGHCYRSNKDSQASQPISDLLFYRGNNSKNKVGQGNKITYIKTLLRDTNLNVELKGDMELQIQSLQATMSDRKAWKRLIKSIDFKPTYLTKTRDSTCNNPHAIFVDGGCNKMTGTTGWGCVVDKDNKDLVASYNSLIHTDMYLSNEVLPDPAGRRTVIVASFTDTTTQFNNGAELLALIAGLRIALHCKGRYTEIYSDSDLCIRFWSINVTSKKKKLMDPNKVKFIEELIDLRKQFEAMGGKITKISGDDNVADLGFHKKK